MSHAIGISPEPIRNGNGNGWQKPAIAGLWALVILFAGWMWLANTAALKDGADQQRATEALVRQSQERIATLEEAVRGLTRSLDRIETGVNDLRDRRR
jgi:hypothetical protein